MSGMTTALRQSILGLSVEEKADLVLEVLNSMEGEAEPGVEAAWAVEIERRAERASAGLSQGTEWATVRGRIERRVFG